MHLQGSGGETPRFLGGSKLDPAWFTTVDSSSPVWSRLATAAQGQVKEVDQAAHGITNYGTLRARGMGSATVAPMELFINGRPQELGRWPNLGTWSSIVSTADNTHFVYSGTQPSRWTQGEEPDGFLVPAASTIGPPVTVVDGEGSSPDEVTVSIPMNAAPQKFARLRVVIPYAP